MKINQIRFFSICGIVLISAVFRCMPHPPNFVPTVALAMFSGYYLTSKLQAVSLVLASMLISDLFLGLHVVMWSTYLSLVLIIYVGSIVKTKKDALLSIAGGTLFSSIIYFVVTNFAVWYSGWLENLYPLTLTGLLSCYIMAIPFLGYAVTGDLFYTAVIFGIFEIIEHKFLCRESIR
ncbi:MAG: hypothetical protein LBE20_06200 [Deltaproteobacteria bacterium]|jgi:hypothetical protein|nr:hypothetical protein [Deltaproteobacteria bacterium]